ncbi:hypothetical protein N0V90_009246 [Kalmusia sp. IMI 367209]|nr:hypothetical protein N0V90_009246 [Kalmusia sp. IMI 367209]
MLNSRRVLVVASVLCVFLFIATFIVHTRPVISFGTAIPNTPVPAIKENNDVPLTSLVPTQHSDKSEVEQPPFLSDKLSNITRFESYGLASEECNAEFSKLFKEIERSAAYRKSIGNVEESDLDLKWNKDGAVRAMIYRQKLFILESKLEDKYFPPRALSILHQIDRAITTSPEPVPDIEFSFVISDIPNRAHAHHTLWALSRLPDDKETWLMPEFGYWFWPLDLVGAYEQIRTEMLQNKIAWEEKTPKVLWRGALKTNKLRGAMYQATRGKEWADIEEVKWKNRTEVSASSTGSAVSMVDHCAYQYIMHTEGRSYSGRGKYLLNCGSVFIMHKNEWVEPHHDAMVASGPGQNIVEVERDFSDLEEVMKKLLMDPQLAQSIAMNGQTTFRDRYLTPAAQACYWRKLFQTWADVSFQPRPWEIVDGKTRLRGTPFETFV